MPRKIDYELMNVLVQSESDASLKGEASSDQINLSAEPRLQPDDEPKPDIPWLYGSPDQATMERCRLTTELSKTLKQKNYDH